MLVVFCEEGCEEYRVSRVQGVGVAQVDRENRKALGIETGLREKRLL